ncbi:hypothetical protein KY359_03785 [Candidatus Woesearchaeota archaeon]|nr:hypothetical protein [Candidatus Woesearchaeota archaeon]
MPDRKVITGDGSPTFHSSEYDETYHSTSGALTEADKKYSEVCGIQDREEVDILDICFGLGYNSAAAIDRFKGRRISIVALEQNKDIVDEIVRMGDAYPFKCRGIMRKVAERGSYSGSATPGSASAYSGKSAVSPDGASPDNARPASNVIASHKGGGAAKLDVKLVMGDARETIKDLDDASFDCVFLDPFSPKKCPELWTEEFFLEIYRVLRRGGKVATYSCARMVRDNFKAAGFNVRDGPVVGRRGPGTTAEKG